MLFLSSSCGIAGCIVLLGVALLWGSSAGMFGKVFWVKKHPTFKVFARTLHCNNMITGNAIHFNYQEGVSLMGAVVSV